MPEINSSFIHS